MGTHSSMQFPDRGPHPHSSCSKEEEEAEEEFLRACGDTPPTSSLQTPGPLSPELSPAPHHPLQAPSSPPPSPLPGQSSQAAELLGRGVLSQKPAGLFLTSGSDTYCCCLLFPSAPACYFLKFFICTTFFVLTASVDTDPSLQTGKIHPEQPWATGNNLPGFELKLSGPAAAEAELGLTGQQTDLQGAGEWPVTAQSGGPRAAVGQGLLLHSALVPSGPVWGL